MNILDRLGMAFEKGMTSFFTSWGTLCSRYPVPVILLSIGFAAGLATGINWLEVTTDPIELWAAPESRSRIERKFFDETFGPFYRTQQVIVHAKDLPTIEYTDYLDKNRTFGPIFNKKEFLLPLLKLQEDIMSITANFTNGDETELVRLTDVCNNPLSR